MPDSPPDATRPTVLWKRAGDALDVTFAGDWSGAQPTPPAGLVSGLAKEASGARVLRFRAEGVTGAGTRLTAWAHAARRATPGVEADLAGLPDSARRLLEIAGRPPPAVAEEPVDESLRARVGHWTLDHIQALVGLCEFLGQCTLAGFRLVLGRGRVRMRDLVEQLVDAGPMAFVIVGLVAFLTGMILAFLGAVQMAKFGAEVYVASGVALAMVREMGPIMAAITLAGRTGAAYAAQIGTMRLNEEIDALRVLGLSPIEFLVVPRLFALTAMMPLLAIYASAFGILGGLVVGIAYLDMPVTQYLNSSLTLLSHGSVLGGLLKSLVFGGLVAMAGCYRGLTCERTAGGVGKAVTSAVVLSIILIIVADAVFAVVFTVFGV